ncbi:MAG: ABC transporter permease [Oscillospiraceae bacterium]|nr:ABC transporter permease [Oscillospiraceae bacterium]
MKKRIRSIKKIALWVLNVLLALAALACVIGISRLAGLLNTQKEAERWRGDNELSFAQLSCFIPNDESIGLDDVYTFRYAMLDKFHEAALDVDNDSTLFVDAWSTGGKAVASTSLGKGDAVVTAVGGAFFDFHPIRLLSGNYFTEGDLMQDRVLLDEDLAWLLFGGTDLAGLELRIDNVPFVVAGVIEREQDFASKKAYTDGMGLFMSYDAYKALHEEAGVTCYELVMAEPVKNFAVSFVREKFPIGGGVILENSGRFRAGRLLDLLRDFGVRSMQSRSISYPYWENAARCVEDWCTLLLLLAIVFALCPAVTLLVLLRRYLRLGRRKLKGEWLPAVRERAEDAVDARRRRIWERNGRKE